MLRHFISLLAILGLFASQLAALPHAHAGMSPDEQQKHDATPHFHCRWLEHDHHGHRHGHDHHRHGHSHGDHSHHPEQPSPSPNPSTLPEGRNEHDATAVYCPGSATAASVAPQSVSLRSLFRHLVDFPSYQFFTRLEPGDERFARGRPPDKILDGSNLYLTLRNLRI
jgi:hypothetical protein